MKRNANHPFKFELSVIEGFHTIADKVSRTDILSGTHIERWYLSSTTRKIPIRQGNIR